MREAVQVAQLEGINLGEADISEWYTFLNALSPDGKTSMLQDVEAGRKTEMEIFGGKVVELGQKHGIATPVNETLVWIIRVLEARKQAAFG
jgi:2-dehydropantoate 2-reductase